MVEISAIDILMPINVLDLTSCIREKLKHSVTSGVKVSSREVLFTQFSIISTNNDG